MPVSLGGKVLADLGAQIEKAAGEGLVPDLERSAGGMLPGLALAPLGPLGVAAQTYVQQRGPGASPLRAQSNAAANLVGLGLGGKVAAKVGGGYLSRVFGYTIAPTVVNEIEQAIETGKLPDPRQVGIDAFKNAVFAAGFGAMHGREPSTARSGAVVESRLPEAPAPSETMRPAVTPDWTGSGQRVGLLEIIRRIAGGVSASPEIPGGNETGPAAGFSHTSRGAQPTYEEVAAKRLRGPGRDGLLQRIQRYSQPPTLLEKIYRHVFGSWPTRAPADTRELYRAFNESPATNADRLPVASYDIVHGGPHKLTRMGGHKHGTESHHVIADAISDLHKEHAPAIRMEETHHWETASHGRRGLAGRAFRQKQRELVEAERYDDALQRGIDDVRLLYGTQYDSAIEQMLNSLPRMPDGSVAWQRIARKNRENRENRKNESRRRLPKARQSI